jgi:soluble lytic murein transglycosylase-like protein
MNKERKQDIRLFAIIIFIIMTIFAYLFISWRISEARVKFLSKYTSEPIAIAELKSADFYELDWLWCVALSIAESNYKQHATSKKPYLCRGIKQLNGSTAKWCADILGYKLKSTSDIYDIAFNIPAGNLTLKTCLKWANGNYYEAMSYYNVGYGTYKKGIPYRNYRYVKKVSLIYNQLKSDWEG